MDSKNMPHHEQETERLFTVKGWKKALVEAAQKGYKKGVRDEQKRVAEEKREHNRQRRGVFLLFLLLAAITFVASGLYTFISGHIKFAGDGWFWGWLATLGTCIFKACTGDKKLSEDTRGDMSAFQSFFSGIEEFWTDIRKNNKLFALFIICWGCLFGGVLGKFEVVSRTVSATEVFGEAWISYDNKDKKENDDDEAGEEPPQMNESIEERPSEEPNDSDESDGNSDIAALIEKSDYDVYDLMQIEISDSELYQTDDLSSEEYEFVFLAGEENVVEDWENQKEIDGVIFRISNDLRGEKKVNRFDGEIAPQDVQNKINYASEDEKKAKSFMEIERIQKVRVDVYRDYPKKSIANLIANSEQLKALVLYYYRGRQQSVLCHYGKSILWEIEYLKYEDVSNNEMSKHLSKIAQRYGDIAFACKDCTESTKAIKLQTAYENAAEWYRGVTDEEDR